MYDSKIENKRRLTEVTYITSHLLFSSSHSNDTLTYSAVFIIYHSINVRVSCLSLLTFFCTYCATWRIWCNQFRSIEICVRLAFEQLTTNWCINGYEKFSYHLFYKFQLAWFLTDGGDCSWMIKMTFHKFAHPARFCHKAGKLEKLCILVLQIFLHLSI